MTNDPRNSFMEIMSSLPETEDDYWGEDPDFPLADWQYEVANGETRCGYHEWKQRQQETPHD